MEEVYQAFKTAKGQNTSIAYNGYTPGDRVSEHDYPGVEQADTFFCGCPEPDAKAIRDAVTRQGFTGQFVALSEPK